MNTTNKIIAALRALHEATAHRGHGDHAETIAAFELASKVINEELLVVPLWTFRFKGDGFNQVYAVDLGSAVHKAKKEFPSLPIDESSFKCILTKEEEQSYYKGMR